MCHFLSRELNKYVWWWNNRVIVLVLWVFFYSPNNSFRWWAKRKRVLSGNLRINECCFFLLGMFNLKQKLELPVNLENKRRNFFVPKSTVEQVWQVEISFLLFGNSLTCSAFWMIHFRCQKKKKERFQENCVTSKCVQASSSPRKYTKVKILNLKDPILPNWFSYFIYFSKMTSLDWTSNHACSLVHLSKKNLQF